MADLRYSLSIARYTLLEAVRSRLILVAVLVVLVSTGLAMFLREVAITEAAQVQSVIVAALIRLCAVFLLIAFVVSSMVREYQDKVIDLAISQPVPRWAYVVGKLLGFSGVAILVAATLSLTLTPIAPKWPLLIWSASLACELMLIGAVSLFCVLTLNHFVTAFSAVAAFYALARSLDAIQIIASGSASSLSWVDRFLSGFVDILGRLLPHFDRITQSAWLQDVALSPSVLGTPVAHLAVYGSLVVSAALFDFYRQDF